MSCPCQSVCAVRSASGAGCVPFGFRGVKQPVSGGKSDRFALVNAAEVRLHFLDRTKCSAWSSLLGLFQVFAHCCCRCEGAIKPLTKCSHYNDLIKPHLKVKSQLQMHGSNDKQSNNPTAVEETQPCQTNGQYLWSATCFTYWILETFPSLSQSCWCAHNA